MNTNQFLADFQFIGNSIRKLNCRNDFVVVPDEPKVKRSFDVSSSIKSIDLQEGNHFGLLSMDISIKISHAGRKFVLSLTIEGCFIASAEKLPIDAFRQMLEMNGSATLYSVARSMVISYTSQMFASGAIMLPMINVIKMKEQEKKDPRPADK